MITKISASFDKTDVQNDFFQNGRYFPERSIFDYDLTVTFDQHNRLIIKMTVVL